MSSKKYDVSNKVVLITGSSSGMGQAMANKLAEYGAHVIVADLDEEKAQAVARGITEKYGTKAVGFEMDVTNERQVNAAVRHAVAEFGGIDTVISNAGIQIISPFIDFTTADWQRVMDVHVLGSFLVTRACMNEMIKHNINGRVIITGSVHSVKSSKDKAAYIVAKHALLGLVRAIAQEGAEYGISSNLVCPGLVETALIRKQLPELAKELGLSEDEVLSQVLLAGSVDKTATTLEDITETVLFLVGFKTNALTGQHILVSHGMGM